MRRDRVLKADFRQPRVNRRSVCSAEQAREAPPAHAHLVAELVEGERLGEAPIDGAPHTLGAGVGGASEATTTR
jgi:hypothetical protein